MKPIIPGIAKVHYIRVEDIFDDMVEEYYSDSEISNYWSKQQECLISTIGTSSLEEERNSTVKGDLYEVSLTFKTTEEISHAKGWKAFLITTLSGERYLIGTKQRPFCSIEKSKVDAPDQPKVNNYTIRYSNRHGMIKVQE